MLFKRKRKVIEPICVHEWYLIDTTIIERYNGVDVDFDKGYEVGCTKCNRTKLLDELGFYHFKNTFKINNI